MSKHFTQNSQQQYCKLEYSKLFSHITEIVLMVLSHDNAVDTSLTRLNLSFSCGGQFRIESTDILLFLPLHGRFGFIAIYQSINVKFFELPQCFTFRIILSLYAPILRILLCIPIRVTVFQVKSLTLFGLDISSQMTMNLVRIYYGQKSLKIDINF